MRIDLIGSRLSFHRSSRSVRSVSAVSTSSAENGSSINSKVGLTTSARAKPTRWRIPPDSSRGYAFSKPSRPIRSMAASARRRRSRAPTPSASSPASTFCNTVSHGNSAKVGTTLATPCAGPDKGFPRYSTAPPLCSIRPAMMRNKVDFPEPERPSRPTISPSARLRLTSSRTRISPYVLLHPRCTRVTRRISNKLTVFQPDGKNPQCLGPNQYQGLALVALFCRGALCLSRIPPSDINQNLLKKYIAYPGIFSIEFAIRPYVGRAEKGSNPAAACFPHKDTADAIIGG